MKKVMYILSFIGAIAVMLTLAACGASTSSNPGAASTSNGVEKKQWVIGFSTDTLNNPWRAQMVNEAKQQAEKHKDQLTLIVTNAQESSSKQISDIEDLLTRKVDVLLVSPHEAQPLTKVISKAYQAGIPVLVLDRETTNDQFTSFIGASNKAIGQKAGEFIANTLNGKGNIVEIQGTSGASPTIDRSEPMQAELAKYPDIKLIAQQPANYDQNQAMEVMQNILQANPKGTIDLVYAHSDNMALGAIKAIKEAGRIDEIKVVSIDGQKEAIQAIKNGEMLATFTYPFPSSAGIDLALKILQGQTVDKNIDLPSTLITKDNADQNYNPDSAF